MYLLQESPIRYFPCMQSHELLREVMQKTSAKEISAELGLSLSMIYKWAESDEGSGSGATNPLDRIEALLRCTKDPRIVQWICERAGGFFIQNPKTSQPHPYPLIPATNQIVQEFATFLPSWPPPQATTPSARRKQRKSAPAGKN